MKRPALLPLVIAAVEISVAVEPDQAITIKRGVVLVPAHHKMEVDPPKDVDSIFKWSGLIHPPCTL